MWLLVQAVRGATSWAGYPSFWPAEALAGLAAFTAACWLMRLQLTADGRVGFPVARRT
jgi:hypothetical protein